jgi:hypothetical protein
MANHKSIGERHIHTQEIAKALREIPEGDTITYEEMTKLIGIDTSPKGSGYQYQYTARDILERDEKIVFECLFKVGLKRLPPEKVALSSSSMYLKRKRSLIRRNKRRIDTVNDVYEDLSAEARFKTDLARTLLSFDAQMTRRKNINKIQANIKDANKAVEFTDTLRLFGV